MKKLPPPTTPPSDPTETLAAIGPVARSSVVDAVSDRLRGEILAGRLAAGSRLPSERELSLALGVNRLTLRAALARLEAMGLVSTRHGSGTEVISWRERAGLEALPMVMSSLEREEPAWIELLVAMQEVRRILVAEAVALAAERHTQEDIDVMQRIAAEQEQNLPDTLAFARGDLAFQRAIVRAARNVGFELILNSFARFPEEQPDLITELYDRKEESLPFYQALIDLVRSGEADAARNTLRSAFAAMDEEWLTRRGLRARVEKGRARASANVAASDRTEKTTRTKTSAGGAKAAPTKKRPRNGKAR
jgi:GntR family transcriptional regulator, transcriptional repressor for pyruvate dehydrogenase complex